MGERLQGVDLACIDVFVIARLLRVSVSTTEIYVDENLILLYDNNTLIFTGKVSSKLSKLYTTWYFLEQKYYAIILMQKILKALVLRYFPISQSSKCTLTCF